MSDKSYVTITLCPICRKDNGELIMDRRLKPTFDMHTVNPFRPCDKCRKKYLSKGVMLVVPETGSLVVLKDEAFKGLFNKPLPKEKIVRTTEEVLEKLRKAGE